MRLWILLRSPAPSKPWSSSGSTAPSIVQFCVCWATLFPLGSRRSGPVVDQRCRSSELRTQAPVPRWHYSCAVYDSGFPRPPGGTGPETQSQSDSLLSPDWGVFAPNSPFRRAVVPGSANPAHKKRQKPAASTPAEPAIDQVLPSAPLTWAERLKRVFDIDISVNAV